ncbi:uncharacterized protein MYCGRDRAFT_91926 [Zymoseptoria tritici IPO323]|uniref:BTB domain-containing protein n=1 Tax=Zymoseptoria tritici (strain CBS 115943 / IPO323) TaxID=336722 RepID=F9X7W9_ZYMTI|nr:uncharacterized protein MYCGRDRAFT_91926 [Zymoseptoria tritici IPO323]EGP89282.1 hypothetical protein MYCGRDRAFT_91926 [Zymoseptoria tritici IPO323]
MTLRMQHELVHASVSDHEMSTSSLSGAFAAKANSTAAADDSDIVLRCGDRTWTVSKSALVAHSKTLKSALEGEWQEASEGVYHFRDDDPAAVEAMVAFISRDGVYPLEEDDSDSSVMDEDDINPSLTDDSDLSSLVISEDDKDCPITDCKLHLKVYNFADKYDITALATVAAAQFTRLGFSDVLRPQFSQVIRELYENSPDNSTTREMKVSVVSACAKYEGIMTGGLYQSFRELLTDIIPFALAFQQEVLANDTERQKRAIAEATRQQKEAIRAATTSKLATLDAHIASPRHPWAKIECQNENCKENFVIHWIHGWSAKAYYCPYCLTPFTRNSHRVFTWGEPQDRVKKMGG